MKGVKSWFKFVTLKPPKPEARNPKSELENTRRRFVEAGIDSIFYPSSFTSIPGHRNHDGVRESQAAMLLALQE